MFSPEAIKQPSEMEPADLFMYVHILVHMFLTRKKLEGKNLGRSGERTKKAESVVVYFN